MLHLHLKNPSIKVYGYLFGMRGVGVREQLPFALVLPILMGVNSWKKKILRVQKFAFLSWPYFEWAVSSKETIRK